MNNVLKTIPFIFIFFLISLKLIAQVPQGINYQAVARDEADAPVANQTIIIEVSIFGGSSSGTLVYQETHEVQTNDYGMFSLVIGGNESKPTFAGTISQFKNIPWDSEEYYIRIRSDFGASSYLNGLIDMGTVKFQSVPYALLADSVVNYRIPKLHEVVDIDPSTLNPNDAFLWNGTDWQTGNVFVTSNGQTDLINDWTISTNNITLTQGTLDAQRVKADTFQLFGVAVREFSTDPFLGGASPSDDAIPVESAVKYYIDNEGPWAKKLSDPIVYNKDDKIGLGTDAPQAKFHAAIGTDNFLVTGTYDGSDIGALGAGTRMAFYPSKAAFRAGGLQNAGPMNQYWDNNYTGIYSVAFGYNTQASGAYSGTMGNANKATGESAFSIGENNSSSGKAAFTSGINNSVTKVASTALGTDNSVTSDNAFATGNSNTVSANYSGAGGDGNVVSGNRSFAFGYGNTIGVSATGAFAAGKQNQVNGWYSVGLGNQNKLPSNYSFSTGSNNESNGDNSFTSGKNIIAQSYTEAVFGQYNKKNTSQGPVPNSWDLEDYLFVVGNGTGDLTAQRSNALTIWKNGKVAIGEDNLTQLGSTTFYVKGAAKVTGDFHCNSLTETSDSTFKTDVVPLSKALQKTLKLEGVSYYWNYHEFPERNFSPELQIGVIAQEVELIYPELVKTDKNGYKSVNYTGLVPVLIEAIKEQQKLIDELKTTNTTQQEQINMLQKNQQDLNKRLKSIEAMFSTSNN